MFPTVGYFDWHEQPGYWRDITRHFPSDTKLLDIGCGTAWIGRHFDDYTGIDSSPDALEASAANGMNVVEADVNETFPFEDSVFGAVVMKDLLEHVDDQRRWYAKHGECSSRAAWHSRPRLMLRDGSGMTTRIAGLSQRGASVACLMTKGCRSNCWDTSRSYRAQAWSASSHLGIADLFPFVS